MSVPRSVSEIIIVTLITWPWKLGYGSHSRSFKLIPFESLSAVSSSPSTVTMAVSCMTSEIKRDVGRKSWFFHIPLHSAAPLGWGVGILPRRLLWKNYGVASQWWKQFEPLKDMCNRFDTILRRVTDGQTDRRTDGHLATRRHSPHSALCTAVRGRNRPSIR